MAKYCFDTKAIYTVCGAAPISPQYSMYSMCVFLPLFFTTGVVLFIFIVI